jgi:hypothetical protein
MPNQTTGPGPLPIRTPAFLLSLNFTGHGCSIGHKIEVVLENSSTIVQCYSAAPLYSHPTTLSPLSNLLLPSLHALHTMTSTSPTDWRRHSVSTFQSHELDDIGSANSRRVSVLTRDEPQFAEFDPRLGPQVFDSIPEDPEPVVIPPTPPPPSAIEPNGTSTHELVGSRRKKPNFCAGTWRWIRRKPYLVAAAGAGLLGLISLIVLPIVLHNLSLNGDLG